MPSMELTHNISVIEVVWTAGCAPGLYYNTRIARRAAGDLATLRIKKINSIREFSAVTSLALFAYLALSQFMFVLIGVLSMLAPNAKSGQSGAQFAVAGVFLLVSVTSSGIGFIVDKRRRALRRMIEALENEDDPAKLKEAIHGVQ